MDVQEDIKENILEEMYKNRLLAHQILFPENRKNVSPEFHESALGAFYSARQNVLLKLFRGAAKSTLTEEGATIGCLFRDFKYLLVIGNEHSAACDRLRAIKHHLETNEMIIELFGSQVGPIWKEDEIVMANGCRLKAFGARQPIRGTKNLSDRPDAALIDDLEDELNVHTEAARAKTARWLYSVLLPAMVPWAKVRMSGTPLHPKALVEELSKSSDWYTITVPICYIDTDTGEEVASWPDRYSMAWIKSKREEYQRRGRMTEWEQEYMVRSEDVASKPFQASMIKVGAAPSGYVPKIVIVDPARTVKEKSARTGYIVISPRIGNRTYVYKGYGGFHKPDEIIKEIVKLDEQFSPVFIGVERDGLEEFIMQPLREVQARLGITLPIVPLKAPKDKIGFITALQVFYNAGEMIHVENLPDLEAELLSFPTGRVDVPNALAYMNKIVPGQGVYQDFHPELISEDIGVNKRHPRYLVVTSRPSMTAAALVQVIDGCVRVMEDWVYNEPPADALDRIIPEARLSAGEFKALAPSEQFDRYLNNGLPAALKFHKVEVKIGASTQSSVGSLQSYMTQQRRGQPMFMVSPNAKWTMNGLMLGYRRGLTDSGTLEDHPTENHYQLVCSAIEIFAKFISSGTLNPDGDLHYAHTADGRQFVSLLPGK